MDKIIPLATYHPAYQKVGERIKRLRIKRGMTQEQLAEQMQCAVSVLQDMENGAPPRSMEAFFDLCDVLSAPPQMLLYDVDDQTRQIFRRIALNFIGQMDDETFAIMSEIYDSERKRRNGEHLCQRLS